MKRCLFLGFGLYGVTAQLGWAKFVTTSMLLPTHNRPHNPDPLPRVPFPLASECGARRGNLQRAMVAGRANPRNADVLTRVDIRKTREYCTVIVPAVPEVRDVERHTKQTDFP